MEVKQKNTSEQIFLLMPFFFGLALGIGIALGVSIMYVREAGLGRQAQQTAEVLKLIKENYVEEVNLDSLHTLGLQSLLSNLDPHSTFIPAEEVALAQSQLETDFEGIGIEYEWLNDTLFVNYPLPQSPAEKAGILSGDKILAIDDEAIAYNNGESITDIFQKLRGKKGTSVKLKILRDSEIKEILVERDKIVSKSVEGYWAKPHIAYIRILRFAEKTDQEFSDILQEFIQKDTLRAVIVDLRENGGGYMDKATRIADEFLEAGLLIVSTKGKQKRYNQEYKATAGGLYEKGKVVVLLDEGSASASEILAGALQDNDKATIIGRKSYGKGLVQVPFALSDGSELRLTVSKYYTPTGRCIQRPYHKGKKYSKSLEERYKSGFLLKDTLSEVKETFFTPKGKKVFGGGGIVPDVALPLDSTKYEEKIKDFLQKTSLKSWIAKYAHQNRKILQEKGFSDFLTHWQLPEVVLNKALAGSDFNETEKKFIKKELKAFLAKIVWGKTAYFQTLNADDKFIEKALENLHLP
ncbi:S41 family peptidase [Raineya sp.]|jgi:carboxyl-terminal processing protease